MVKADVDAVALKLAAWRNKVIEERDEARADAAGYLSALKRMTDRYESLVSDRAAMMALTDRIGHARRKHPEGASLGALGDEVREVGYALVHEGPIRMRDELLDVATVAMRLYLGEGSL